MSQIEIELNDALRDMGIQRLLLRPHHLARSLKLKLTHRAEVIIVYPKRQPEPDWKEMIMSHQQWLSKKIAKLDLSPEQNSQPRSILLTATKTTFEVDYTFKKDSRNCYYQKKQQLHICHGNANEWALVLKRWLMSQAKAELSPWLDSVSTRIGLPFRRVTIRNQQRRWGSCNQHGDISLNAKLMFLDPDIVEYLFMHELCHTVHMNHSPAYWQLVESIQPDWRFYDRQLQNSMQKLPHWIF